MRSILSSATKTALVVFLFLNKGEAQTTTKNNETNKIADEVSALSTSPTTTTTLLPSTPFPPTPITTTTSSPAPTRRPSTVVSLESCVDTPESIPYENFPGCNDESVFCDDAEIQHNCCKCKIECCGQCNNNSNGNDNTDIDDTIGTGSFVNDPCHPDNNPTVPSITPNPAPVPSSNPSILFTLYPTHSPTKSSDSNEEDEEDSAFRGSALGFRYIIFFILFFIFTLNLRRRQFVNRRRMMRYRAARAERIRTESQRRRRRQQQQGNFEWRRNNGRDGMIPDEEDNTGWGEEDGTNIRYQQIVSKFYFQTVVPDKSNINPESLQSPNEATTTTTTATTTTTTTLARAKSDNSTTASILPSNSSLMHMDTVTIGESDDSTNQEENDNRTNKNTATSISSTSIREAITSWTAAITSTTTTTTKDECCICLDTYNPGETICMSKSPKCNHLFHSECVLEWMKTHDHCPLCRVDLMN